MVRAWNVAPDKIVVMPNGVDVALFTPEHDARPVRQEFGLGEGPVISFVGGFQKWHGLEQLVESFVQVLHEVPAARLLLIGDGRHRPVVQRRIAELGVESAVVITGLVPQTRVPALLAAADIAVLPYPQLPQELWFSPLKLYEYMAAGKAIVASRAGQIAEVIHHGRDGYLVDPGNVNDLARALVTLIREPAERQRLGDRARQRAVACHSWVHYIERLEAIYDDVLDAQRSLGRR
jgi:glycosyltransferase involved in cell wall biosynthesis